MCSVEWCAPSQEALSVNKLDLEQSRGITDLECRFGTTCKKGQSVEEMARKGKKFVAEKPEALRRFAMSPDAFTA